MNQDLPVAGQPDVNRREFLRSGSLATLMAMMGGVPLRAEDKDKPQAAGEPLSKPPDAPPVNCALIGCGLWGREVLKTLAALPNAPVVGICDTYEPFLRRARESAPKAGSYTDYKELLANKDVQAVFVATPSHQHRAVTLAALKAGKHVYCEAPLAHTIEDARAIAQAARAATKVNFQAGLQLRSDNQRHFVLKFIRSGAIGRAVFARTQWHKKQSWRRPAPNAEREMEVNWRLRRETSPGLLGELAIHQLDMATMVLDGRPVSVTGYGGLLHWTNDDRDVPDTVQAFFQFPNGVNVVQDCALTTSFEGDYEVYYGTDSAILFREDKGWLFKEVDAPLLGWEVYAKKEAFHKETGIALVADASKAKAYSVTDASVPVTETPLYKACEAFVTNSHIVTAGVQDYVENFGENEQGLREYLAGLAKNRMPAAGYQEGFEATVLALKANEAVLKGQKITFQKEWFELG
jgi:predicted dehydrogenase